MSMVYVSDTDAEPVVFAVNKNLFVMVKIINCKYLHLISYRVRVRILHIHL